MTLKYAANLTMLYNEVPFLDRFDRAAAAGFGAVEFLFPYEEGIDTVKARVDHLGLKVALFNLHPGDATAGEWGTLSDPERRDYFRWSFSTALEAASRLNCNRLNAMFGHRLPRLEREVQIECALDNLAWAAPQAADAHVTLLIEALNPVDFPSCFVLNTATALEIVAAADHAQVKLLYDVYHAQMTEGNLINTIVGCLGQIGHIQIADVPGRHEPGTGEINFAAVLDTVDKLAYHGYIGLEYVPSRETDMGLEWLPREARLDH